VRHTYDLISSDGGAMLLGLAERRIGIADRLAAEITDRRDPMRVVHTLSDILRARILAIACGYEDADDLDYLRSDPALKLACGHLPDSGRDLCSQRYGAKSWHVDRRVAARIEATTQRLDIRYVLTSFSHSSAEWLYDSLCCARGQA
jgi:Transposase DDE domain group 1